jgi:hypothetical protein
MFPSPFVCHPIKKYCSICADEDSNGEIDQLELKHCFQKLDISFTDEEIKDLFEACDIYEHMGMKFNEFIVFLCLVYLLNDPAVSEAVSFILLCINYPYFQSSSYHLALCCSFYITWELIITQVHKSNIDFLHEISICIVLFDKIQYEFVYQS